MYITMLKERFRNKAETLEWIWHECDDGSVELESWSPVGEDIIVYLNGENIPVEMREYVDNFDPDEHVRNLVIGKKHGLAGVSNDMQDLVNDSRNIQAMLDKLAKAFEDAASASMTKAELKAWLENGGLITDVFSFAEGEECDIFKAEEFKTGDEIIYIPDIFLNELPLDGPVTDTEIVSEVLSNCYTGDDFIELCNGDIQKAERLFWFCNWQHPSSALDEGAIDDDDDEPISDNDSLPNKWYGIVRWTVNDVIAAVASRGITMTVQDAEKWWGENERAFCNRMVELGNEVLELMTDDIVAN